MESVERPVPRDRKVDALLGRGLPDLDMDAVVFDAPVQGHLQTAADPVRELSSCFHAHGLSLRYGSFAASTSTDSICGCRASSSPAFSVRAAATAPSR